MRIQKIEPTFTSIRENKNKQNSDFLTKFHEKVKNPADMTDTIVVPRTIFKGYLGIMAGTTLITLGSLFNKHPKASKSLSFLGILTSLYGTYSFVRPYVFKDCKGVEKTKV